MFARWPRRSRIYLGLSMILAALAGMLFRTELAGGSPARSDGPSVAVVVARTAISRGQVVRPPALRLTRIPRVYAPPGAFTNIRQASGRVALTDLAAGEAATITRLARVRAGPVASLIPEGLRAFAVPSSLPAGTVVAGDRVDILATYGGGGGQPHTETVVSGVEILLVLSPSSAEGSPAAGGLGAAQADAAAAGATDQSTLVLLVSPDQEERLAFARAFADISVVIAPGEESPG